MKIWSKGLGKMELVMDFEKIYVEREDTDEGEHIYIKGTIKDPVIWDFRITMTEDDIPGLLNVALDKKILAMFIKRPKQSISSSLKYLMKQFNIGNGAATERTTKDDAKGKAEDKKTS